MLTEREGMVAGYVAGGRGRQLRPVVIPGNLVEVDLRSKSDNQLPFAKLELLESRGPWLAEPLPAAAIAWICALTATALPERQPLPEDVANRPLPGPVANARPLVLRHQGDANQAAAMIAWPTGGGAAGLAQSRKLDLLSQIIGNRLLDSLREAEGASYTPLSTSDWPVDAESGGYLLALVLVQPDDVETVFARAEAIAGELATTGPTMDDLQRVTEPMRQNIFRAQNSHMFWLNRMEGGLFDPLRLANLPTLASDYLNTTPEEIQALAQRYLVDSPGLRVVILPQEQ